MEKSKPVSTRTRFEVLKRDNFSCQYCGAGYPTTLHVDHIEARAVGGSREIENLITACIDCNLGKAAGRISAEQTQAMLFRSCTIPSWLPSLDYPWEFMEHDEVLVSRNLPDSMWKSKWDLFIWSILILVADERDIVCARSMDIFRRTGSNTWPRRRKHPTDPEVNEALSGLRAGGLIETFKTGGRMYIYVPQKIHRYSDDDASTSGRPDVCAG